MHGDTFLWHDYETFGANPRRDRPAQFAAVRTDMALNEVGEPMMWYCQPALDFLPDPHACLITGITPQLCLERGLPEHAFAAHVESALAADGTIGVGYNTIRFDDEVTRFMLWRNLMDPYAREWQNGCGRWDLLDVVRAAYALRPEGIQWPQRADGSPSFKLTDLSAANGLLHEAAHDALSDVRATIALARLLRRSQPRLFDFCLALHRKDRVMAELGLPARLQDARPFLHVSGMLGVERGCLALMWPLAMHPNNKNELLAWDLAHDPQELASLDADTVRQRLFTRAEDLPEGVKRLPIKSVHLNRSPVVMSNLKVLSQALAERWGLNLEVQLARAAVTRDLPDMSAIWAMAFSRPAAAPIDVDQDLYGGFVSDADRRRLNELRALPPDKMAAARPAFLDHRLSDLFFRYRARNFPASLSVAEAEQWQHHCAARLLDGADGALTTETFMEIIDALGDSASPREEEILGALYDYADLITPERK